MKKLLLIILSLMLCGGGSLWATKKYADLSRYGSNWDSETKNVTMSWTAAYGNQMQLSTGTEPLLLTGDLSEYTLWVNTVSITDAPDYRILLYTGNDNSAIKVSKTGLTSYKLSEVTGNCNIKNVTSIVLSGSSSGKNENADKATAVISQLYLEKPMTFAFDDHGVAIVDVTDLTASGCFSLDDQTGVLTNNYEAENNTTGALTVTFPNGGVDMSNCYGFKVNYDSNTKQVLDGIYLNETYKFGNNFTGRTDIAPAMKDYTALTSWAWGPSKNTTGEMKIQSIEFYASCIAVAKAGETVLNTLPYYTYSANAAATAAWNMGMSTATYYGSGSSDADHYVDLTGYEELRIYRDDETDFRAFFFNSTTSKADQTITKSTTGTTTWHAEEKYYSIDLSKVEKYGEKVYLNTVKSSASWIKDAVNNIVVYKTPEVGAPQYTLSGSGLQLSSTSAALKDKEATLIDATGVTGTSVELASANPNCLFTASSGVMVGTMKNVVVESAGTYTAPNGVALTDGNLFNAPFNITSTSSSYKREAVSGWSTTVLPFELTLPVTGVEVYELTGEGTGSVTFTKKESGTIAANTPFVYKATGDVTFEGANIETTKSGYNIQDVGNTGWKIAQSMEAKEIADVATDGDLSTYDVYGISDDKFVHATKKLTISPFRAFFLKAKSDGAPARYNIVTAAVDEATGIIAVETAEKTDGATYNVAGQHVGAGYKGIVVKNGKKYLQK